MFKRQAMSEVFALSRWDDDGGQGPPDPNKRKYHNTVIQPAPQPQRHDVTGWPPPTKTNDAVQDDTIPMTAIRVLLVEDEPSMGLLFSEVLEGLGYVVCAIESTEADAVSAAARCKPDLMLVDVQLGVGSGIAAVAEILRNGFVPHVFYSGDISGVRAARPNAVALQKPFRIRELAQAINRALGAPVPGHNGASV